jgi:hypothetical protein
LSIMLAVTLSYVAFIVLRYIPFITNLLEFLSLKNVEFCQVLSLYLLKWLSYSFYFHLFTCVEFYKYSWDESYWVFLNVLKLWFVSIFCWGVLYLRSSWMLVCRVLFWYFILVVFLSDLALRVMLTL